MEPLRTTNRKYLLGSSQAEDVVSYTKCHSAAVETTAEQRDNLDSSGRDEDHQMSRSF